MRKNASQFASKKYPNLYKDESSPFWIFKKYSKERRRKFVFSTREEKDEARAYKRGVEEFDRWLGTFLPSGRKILLRDLARAVLASKEGLRPGTITMAKHHITKHVVPAFGHLRPDQITSLEWERFIQESRKKKKTRKFFNIRKALLEILIRAESEGLLKRVPKLVLPDAPPAPPVYLDREKVRAILKVASPMTKLWSFIMWKQGARPSEVLKYRWDMINFSEGGHGTIKIPGSITKTARSRTIPLNSRVSRVLRLVKARSTSEWLFPSPVNVDRPMAEYKTGWETACRKAGVKAVPYNLRDTCITDMLKRGVSSTFVAKYVDNSTMMIDKMYAVAEPEVMKMVAN